MTNREDLFSALAETGNHLIGDPAVLELIQDLSNRFDDCSKLFAQGGRDPKNPSPELGNALSAAKDRIRKVPPSAILGDLERTTLVFRTVLERIGPGSDWAGKLTQSANALRDALDRFYGDPNPNNTWAVLDWSHRLWSVVSVTHCATSDLGRWRVSPAIAERDRPSARLKFWFPDVMDAVEVGERLAAFGSIYNILVTCMGIDPSEFPLVVVWFETGSSEGSLLGIPEAINALQTLFGKVFDIVRRKFTTNGRLEVVAERAETTRACIALLRDLESVGLDPKKLGSSVQLLADKIASDVQKIVNGRSAVSIGNLGVDATGQKLLEGGKVPLGLPPGSDSPNNQPTEHEKAPVDEDPPEKPTGK